MLSHCGSAQFSDFRPARRVPCAPTREATPRLHSEYSSPTDKTHLLQIWILPEKENLEPSYEQIYFPPEEKKGKLKLVASRAGSDGSVTIHQDVSLYSSILAAGEEVSHELAENRYAWIQVVNGSLEIPLTSTANGFVAERTAPLPRRITGNNDKKRC